jgi:hypothetical protein
MNDRSEVRTTQPQNSTLDHSDIGQDNSSWSAKELNPEYCLRLAGILLQTRPLLFIGRVECES